MHQIDRLHRDHRLHHADKNSTTKHVVYHSLRCPLTTLLNSVAHHNTLHSLGDSHLS